eukprot:6332337-Alexandrium_andersonii.AAC.1
MSASLVGSEMCIRDSPDTGYAAASTPWPNRHCPCTSGAQWALGGEVETCLLYTSDAADDM